MTQASLKRAYSRLVGMVERQAHSKFKKRPTLIFCPGGRPRSEGKRLRRGKTVVGVKRAVIKIPKRMAENEDLAKMALVHELRSSLAIQNGQSETKAHRIAKRSEKIFQKKLGIDKSPDAMLKKHYGR